MHIFNILSLIKNDRKITQGLYLRTITDKLHFLKK